MLFHQGHPGRPFCRSVRSCPKSAVGRHGEAVWSDDISLPDFLSTVRNKSVHRWLEIEGRLTGRIWTSPSRAKPTVQERRRVDATKVRLRRIAALRPRREYGSRLRVAHR